HVHVQAVPSGIETSLSTARSSGWNASGWGRCDTCARFPPAQRGRGGAAEITFHRALKELAVSHLVAHDMPLVHRCLLVARIFGHLKRMRQGKNDEGLKTGLGIVNHRQIGLCAI